MQKNVNTVVVIVSPVALHQVSYTYVASHIHTQLCSANCGCPKHRVLVVTVHVHDMVGILEQNSGKPDKQTGIQKSKSRM